jgi:UDP-N-acetylglucosamine--N-acetylmuramyl-(pentapeptide) pyrophosphoryl-undecaprenol N-acetylglucosamine transferase
MLPIKPLLPRLLERFYVIHQTGESNLEEFKTIKNERYFVFGQTDPKNMAEILAKSDIVISRSGANTCWELMLLKKPSILIPIPWTYNDEATENAKYLEKVGLSRIILQKELSPQRLNAEIEILIDEYPSVIKKTNDLISPDIDASEKIVDILEENINKD